MFVAPWQAIQVFEDVPCMHNGIGPILMRTRVFFIGLIALLGWSLIELSNSLPAAVVDGLVSRPCRCYARRPLRPVIVLKYQDVENIDLSVELPCRLSLLGSKSLLNIVHV